MKTAPRLLVAALTALAALAAAGWIAPEALGVVEVAAKEDFAAVAGFDRLDQRTYGAARLIFLRRRAVAAG